MGIEASKEQEQKGDEIIALFSKLTVGKQLEILEELKKLNAKELKSINNNIDPDWPVIETKL